MKRIVLDSVQYKPRVVCVDSVNLAGGSLDDVQEPPPRQVKNKEECFVSGIQFRRVSNYLFNNARWLTEKDSEENNS